MYLSSTPSLMRTLRCIGVPSSSKLVVPRAFGIVPSSTIVKTGLATVCPSFPVNAPICRAMLSASRGCPTASWTSTPPHPFCITTSILPAGASFASSIAIDSRAAARATSSGVTSSNISKPEWRLRRSRPMWRVPFPSLRVCTMKKRRGSSSAR